MRAIGFGLCLAACGGAALSPKPTPAPTPARTISDPDRPTIDPIAALAPGDAPQLSWVVPGPVQLELGGTLIAAGGSGRPIEVGPIDHQGNLERIAVRLDHARFSVWIDRSHLLSVLTRDQRIDVLGVPSVGEAEVVLRAGAIVRRLAHRNRSTQVRYLGALQVEGWVPDSVLADRGPPHDGTGRIPTGRKTLMVVPGAVIRTEPRWTASELAIMANGYFLDTIRELDDAWTEVSYQDGDVAVHGFVSKRDPPGRVHRWHESEGTTTVTANTTVASGTCLYARPRGEAIGYVVGNRPVDLDDTSSGWWSLTIDTPWGPLGFAARGPSKTELVSCGPLDALPSATP
ncbi:MAG: hypothetical protein E6J90_22410 [Deltaproteobacteria bacterium]|nr:MAG: hypothetical protein E6J91_24290 [Deltaproteobacteria bacterium]TMQ17394.1 MAG: hypothetical protein E6J90_22410 [Deltaproteobacteria bacterium]